jgi:predicted DNA-binding protein
MPSPKTRPPDLSIYSSSDDLRNSLKSLRKKSGLLTYQTLMRRMIEHVSVDEHLEEAIRAYYVANSPRWINGKNPITIRFRLDEDTLDLARALAFRICAKGSLSEVGRVIVRYYASHTRVPGLISSLQEEPKNNIAAAERVQPAIIPFEPRKKKKEEEVVYKATSFNLDTETAKLLAELVQTTHTKSMALVSQLIEEYLADDDRFTVLRHSDALLEEHPASKDIVLKRFNFTERINDLLLDLTKKVLFNKNKSAMLRALIKVEAELQGLRWKENTGQERERMVQPA